MNFVFGQMDNVVNSGNELRTEIGINAGELIDIVRFEENARISIEQCFF